jgi:glucokinase
MERLDGLQIMTVVLAADVGGTKMLAALVDQEGRCARVLEAPTPAREGAAAVIQALKSLLLQAQGGMAPAAVGLSLAGVIDPNTACVLDATEAMPGWRGSDLRAALASFAVPVHALNDVHAALLAEAWCGALQGAQRGAMLTLGTGLGGAFLAEGRLQTGAHHLAGHWGRTEVMQKGQRVALETLLSGTGLAFLHRELGGASSSAREVLAAQQSDPAAREALRLWVEQLALLAHNLHWGLDPGVLLLGGGLIDARAQWWPQLMKALGDLPLQVRPAELGSRAGLIGAAKHALNALDAAHAVIDPRGLI